MSTMDQKMGEDKVAIIEALNEVLKLTRENNLRLEYKKYGREEVVHVWVSTSVGEHIMTGANVNCDSGVAMIYDVMKEIMMRI